MHSSSTWRLGKRGISSAGSVLGLDFLGMFLEEVEEVKRANWARSESVSKEALISPLEGTMWEIGLLSGVESPRRLSSFSANLGRSSLNSKSSLASKSSIDWTKERSFLSLSIRRLGLSLNRLSTVSQSLQEAVRRTEGVSLDNASRSCSCIDW